MCSHKINAVLHCRINFKTSSFLAFAVALCSKIVSGCEGDRLEPAEKSNAFVMYWCASRKSVVALRSTLVPLYISYLQHIRDIK